MKIVRLLVASGACLLAACAVLEERALTAETLYANTQCGTSEASAHVGLIADQAQLDALYQRLGRTTTRPMTPPQVDFARHAVVLVEMGQRPTGGYAIALADRPPTVHDGALEMHVRWHEPAPDMLQAQVVTSPCLLIKLPAGDYRRVVVRDEQGRVRATTDQTR